VTQQLHLHLQPSMRPPVWSVSPTEAGTFDCNPDYLTPVAIDRTTAFKG
jgi:hypothetical protein